VKDLKAAETSCLCAVLRQAARSAAQLYDLVLEPTGLRATQFYMLKVIAEAGEIPQWKFAREHAVAVETLSRRFATLRRRKLIAVRTGSNHGEQIYSLTKEGMEAFTRAVPYWERAQSRLKRTLGRPQSKLLLQLCERAVEAARDAEELRTINCPAEQDAQQSAIEQVVTKSINVPAGEIHPSGGISARGFFR
jgi:DNA-binding MarR family transcriptional regulator